MEQQKNFHCLGQPPGFRIYQNLGISLVIIGILGMAPQKQHAVVTTGITTIFRTG